MNALAEKPILFVDVDGVISLFGFPLSHDHSPGPFYWVDGVAHCIPAGAGERLARLSEVFELVWATGWEHRANEHLPAILGLEGELPTLDFGGRASWGSSHWKLEAIANYAGDRPLAWIDDNLDEELTQRWARNRPSPTLLVETRPAIGMTDEHVQELLDWGRDHSPAARRRSEAA